MAGYSKIYVIGGEGGFLGSDGVNPIEFLVLVGDADRQWLEPHYFDKHLGDAALCKLLLPAQPDSADNLLDACIAFASSHFTTCESLADVSNQMAGVSRLDLADAKPQSWIRLREEARPVFRQLNIWRAELVPHHVD